MSIFFKNFWHNAQVYNSCYRMNPMWICKNNQISLVSRQIVYPRVSIRTSIHLARRPLSRISTELQSAFLLLSSITTLRSISKVTSEHRGGGNSIERLGILHPIDQFLTGYKVHIGQGQNGVDKSEESFLSVRSIRKAKYLFWLCSK